MTKKNSFLLYQDQREVVEKLTDMQAGRLFKAIFQHNDGEKLDLDPILSVVFIPIRQTLDRCKENYEKKSKVNSDSANKRWEQARNNANACERIPENAKAYDSDSDSDNDIKKRLDMPNSSNFTVSPCNCNFPNLSGTEETPIKHNSSSPLKGSSTPTKKSNPLSVAEQDKVWAILNNESAKVESRLAIGREKKK